jgi:hypothetical protein
MTCQQCARNSGEYDIRKLCCAARLIDDQTKATYERLMAKAVANGHDEADVRNAIAERRRKTRKPTANTTR